VLRIIQVKNYNDQEKIFAELSNEDYTWIVSDLRSKFSLQKKLKQKNGYFESSQVLRVRELWSKLLFRIDPDCRVFSRDFLLSYIDSFLTPEFAKNFELQNLKAETLFKYIEELMPILSHPSDHEILSDWFEQNPNSRDQWKAWFEISLNIWNFLAQKKILSSSWVAGFLLNSELPLGLWQKPLVFDLGCELFAVESELVRELSNVIDVVVIEPVPDFSKDFYFVRDPYLKLRLRTFEEQSVKQNTNLEIANNIKIKSEAKKLDSVYRFSTNLAEVKHAVHSVRTWLDEGVKPENIAIIAPDIEVYWSALRLHLQCEGVPLFKEMISSFQDKPHIIAWRSRLRIFSKDLTFENLELTLFDAFKEPILSVDKFISQYQVIFSSSDLSRHLTVENFVDQNTNAKIDFTQAVTRDHFILWIIKQWEKKETPFIEDLFKITSEIFKDVPPSTEFHIRSWLDYLDRVISKIDIKNSESDPNGIQCINLLSSHVESWTHRIFIGLSEDQLKSKSIAFLKSSEIMSLESLTGHLINHPDSRLLDFQLRWLDTAEVVKNIFMFAETNFVGTDQAPSLFWLEQCLKQELDISKVTSPSLTRWDELQQLKMTDSSLEEEKFEKIILEKDRSLSPGSLERLLECPFIFAAEKIFNLIDPEIVDLDQDARGRGTLQHAVCERLTEEPIRFDYADDELIQMIQSIIKNSSLKFVSLEFKRMTEISLLKLAKRFLISEKEWRAKHPESKTLLREKAFEFFIDLEPQAYKVRGKIDRLDIYTKNSSEKNKKNEKKIGVVIDYKSSLDAYSSAASWLKNNELQLLGYIAAMESQGLLEDEIEIVGAYYYGLKKMDRKGFVLSDVPVEFMTPITSKSVWSIEDKQKAMQEFSAQLVRAASLIRLGELYPIPKDLKTCKSCQWSKVCRAPHLNL
jgi:RecB family exonuclease